MRYWIGWMILFLLGGACVWQGCGVLLDSGQTLLHYKNEEGVSRKQLEALEESLPELSAWRIERNVEVSNKDMGKTRQGTCVLVYGNREKAAYYGLDSGTYGFRSDEKGCIISRGLAMDIFGSVSVSGKELWCRGERYIVRGVTSDPGYLIQLPAKRTEEKGFFYVALSGEGETALGRDVDQLMFQHGISQDYIKADGRLYLTGATFCLLIPLWTMTGCGLYLFFREREWEWGRFTACCLFFCLAAISILFLKSIGFSISPELIPDKWSNFAFLADAFKKNVEELKQAGEISNIPWVELISRRLMLQSAVSLALSAGTAAFTFHFAFDT